MRLRTLPVLVLVPLALAGCGQARAGQPVGAAPAPASYPWDPDCGSPAPRPTSTLDKAYEINGQLSTLAEKMRPVTEAYPQFFGGLVLETECDRVVVYRLPSAVFDRALSSAVDADSRLLLRPALHTQAELLALSQRVQADLAYWKARGVDVNSTGPAPDGSALIVGTQQVERVRAEFPVRYGIDIAFFVEEMGPAVPLVGSA
jgi:hypothetical protein